MMGHQKESAKMENNPYTQIVGSFLKDNPNLFKESTQAEKTEISNNLATNIQGLVRYLTPQIAQREITEIAKTTDKPMYEDQRQAITNMARLRAEETAFNQILYEMVEPY